jgi:hypothetical protein
VRLLIYIIFRRFGALFNRIAFGYSAVDEAKEPPPHAVDDVFRVLDKYPENRQAVQVCGFSLQALLKVPSSAKTIVSLDWISLVLRILRIHDDDEDILVNFLPLVDLLIQTHALSLKPVNVKSACWLAKELWKVASRPATPYVATKLS